MFETAYTMYILETVVAVNLFLPTENNWMFSGAEFKA